MLLTAEPNLAADLDQQYRNNAAGSAAGGRMHACCLIRL
jgi:hypothetical protein